MKSTVEYSEVPYEGCYDRSYYDKRGRFHRCYTDDPSLGTSRTLANVSSYIVLCAVVVALITIVGGKFIQFVHLGGKIDGDPSRMLIEDRIDRLTAEEELEVMSLLGKVYDISGMPVAVYICDYSLQNQYQNISDYAEELYYLTGSEQDAMVVLIAEKNVDGFLEREYAIYCGDDTVKCFAENVRREFEDNLRRGMVSENVPTALDYAWNSVMNDLAKFSFTASVSDMFNSLETLAAIPIALIVWSTVMRHVSKSNEIYRYFRDNPDKLSMEPMRARHSTCPNCGADNHNDEEICIYCGSSLKIIMGSTQYVGPNDRSF